MDWITNEMLFYSGLAITAFSLIAAIVYALISLICMMRLKAKLFSEYGEK